MSSLCRTSLITSIEYLEYDIRLVDGFYDYFLNENNGNMILLCLPYFGYSSTFICHREMFINFEILVNFSVLLDIKFDSMKNYSFINI